METAADLFLSEMAFENDNVRIMMLATYIIEHGTDEVKREVKEMLLKIVMEVE